MSGSNEDEVSNNQSNNFTRSPTEVEDGGEPLVTPPQDLDSLGVASPNANTLCPGIEPLPYDKANGQSPMDQNIGTTLLELVDASSPRPHKDLLGKGDSSPDGMDGGLRPKISGDEAKTKTIAPTETEAFTTPAEASPMKGVEPKDHSNEEQKPTPWTSSSMYHYHAYPPPPSWYYQHQHYYYPPPPLPSIFQPRKEGQPVASSPTLSVSTQVNHDNLNSPLLYGRSHKRELYNRPQSAHHILDLSDNDVVCGRGGAINKVPGNVRFRRLINEYRHQYMSASKIDKPMLVRHVMESIKPGRFLVKFSQGYLECSEERAKEKTGQALREGAAKLRKTNPDEREMGVQNSSPVVGRTTVDGNSAPIHSYDEDTRYAAAFDPPRKRAKHSGKQV